MKNILLALVLAASLAACATPPATQVSASARSSVTGFATLANFGTWEMDLAPVYTRLAALRHRAARQLDARTISVATAVEVQQLADAARSKLDASRRGNQTEPTPAQRTDLAEAKRLIAAAETKLEH